jgi:hypothetical protein
VLAGAQAGQRLRGVHLRRRAQDDGVHLLQRQALGQVGGDMADAVFRGHFLRLVELAADERHHLDAVDQPDRVQVLGSEGARARERHPDRSAHQVFSRTRWPTAVLDAGT